MSIARVAVSGNAFRDTKGAPSVFGYDIATQGILEALVRHGSAEQILVFADLVDLPWLAKASRSLGSRIRLLPDLAMVHNLDDMKIDVWCSPGQDRGVGIYYRNTFGTRLFPFTACVHCLGYPSFPSFVAELLSFPWEPCDSFICTSRASRDAFQQTIACVREELEEKTGLRRDFGGRLDILPLGVDTEVFKPADKSEARRELGFEQDATILLYFGRWSPFDKADLLPLLRVFQRLCAANPARQLRLVVAGADRADLRTGPGYGPTSFAPALQAMAAQLGIISQVTLLDGFPSAQRVTLYNAADIFTSPVDNCQETFGITPVEAMACGVPQVVADWDGYRDTVQNGTTGFLVPTYWYGSCDADLNPLSTFMPSGPITNSGYHGLLLAQSVVVDPERYAAAFQQLIDNPSLRERMASESRRRAVAMFDWATIASRYDALWTELIQVAHGLSPTWDRKRSFMNNWRLDYCRRFSGFASQLLSGEESLAITEEGCRLRDGSIAFPYHAAIEQAVEPKVVDPALVGHFLGKLSESRMRLRDFCLDDTPSSHAKASRVALWLLKHGFAKLG